MSQLPVGKPNNETEDQKLFVYVVVEHRDGWGDEAWQAPDSTEELISIHKTTRGANDAAITYYKEKVLYDGAGERWEAPGSCFVNGLFRVHKESDDPGGEHNILVEVRQIEVED